MFGEWYNSSLRRYIVLMGDLFSNIQIVRNRGDENKLIKVPVSYASKERFMARLYRNFIDDQSNKGLNAVAKVETILPRINLYMVSMSYNSSYKTNTLNRSSTARVNNTGGVTQYNPTPIKLMFEMGIYTRLQDDMFQILEQIVPYFQPHFTTTMTELYGNDITFDRDIRIVLRDTSPDETIDGDPDSRRHIEWLLTFELNGWIYPPVSDVKGEIKSVYLDFFANNKELSANGTYESVDIIPTSDDESTWDGSVKDSYTSNLPIPSTPTLRENDNGRTTS